jgi:hypothetical protein
MKVPRIFWALALTACSKPDPFENPDYAAACHGPPIETIEARQKAMEDGYTISNRFDCIEKKSWEDVQRATAIVAGMVEKARHEVKAVEALPADLAAARQGFHTELVAPSSGMLLPKPPAELFVRADYTGAEGRTLAAFVTPDPRDGQRHAALVWITGGDSNSLDDFWTPGRPDHDESASAFREAGLVLMFPTLRGGNIDPGKKEFFFGEVDDIHAASNQLARLAYVDPARIYLGGHSTGGTLALLAAETGGRFAAVFAFGPVGEVDHYPTDIFPAARTASLRELRLRSPIHWLNGISTPTYIIEGTGAPSNIVELDAMRAATTNPQVHFAPIAGANHFSVLDGVGRVLAARLVHGNPVEDDLMHEAEAGNPTSN